MMRRMSNPSIIPSAQRLAEANNVNWRTLQGSGDGGSVVERDVLAHLAGVMLGEEETDPTPEPLPEGMRGWPEEAERRYGAGQNAFAAPQPPAAETETASPWSFGPSTPEPTPAPVSAGGDDVPSPQAETEAFNLPEAQAEPETAEPVRSEEPDIEYGAENGGDDPTDAPPAEPVAGVSEEIYQAAQDELELLKTRVETLQDERSRYLGELEGLTQLQRTTESQGAELVKLAPLQGEVAQLKDQLAAAQTEAQRVQELSALNQDLEKRLERAREFKEGAKAELERIMATNAALEAQLATSEKRPWWKFGG